MARKTAAKTARKTARKPTPVRPVEEVAALARFFQRGFNAVDSQLRDVVTGRDVEQTIAAFLTSSTKRRGARRISDAEAAKVAPAVLIMLAMLRNETRAARVVAAAV